MSACDPCHNRYSRLSCEGGAITAQNFKGYVTDAILDILAKDSRRRLVNLEIQRKDTIDHAKRTRFYAAMIDSGCLDGSDVAGLMNYFKTTDPEDMSQGDLSARIHFLKCEEGDIRKCVKFLKKCHTAMDISKHIIDQRIDKF